MMRAMFAALRRFLFGEDAGGGRTGKPRELRTVSCARGASLAGRHERTFTMNAAYEKLCEHLTNQNIGFWSRSEDLSICTDFRGEVGTYRIFARVDPDDSL